MSSPVTRTPGVLPRPDHVAPIHALPFDADYSYTCTCLPLTGFRMALEFLALLSRSVTQCGQLILATASATLFHSNILQERISYLHPANSGMTK